MLVKIIGQYDFKGGDYERSCYIEDVNLIPGGTNNLWMNLKNTTPEISSFKAIVVSYSDFDGEIWENPIFDEWIDTYKNKKVDR